MKIGPKEAAMRALAARRVSKPAKSSPSKRTKAPVASVQRKKAKPSVRAKKPVSPRKAVAASKAGLATPPPAKIGRPPTGFDRVAYQRVYTRLRRLYGPLQTWPPAALHQLRSASKGTPDA